MIPYCFFQWRVPPLKLTLYSGSHNLFRSQVKLFLSSWGWMTLTHQSETLARVLLNVVVAFSLWEVTAKANDRLSVLRPFCLLQFVRVVHFPPYLKRQQCSAGCCCLPLWFLGMCTHAYTQIHPPPKCCSFTTMIVTYKMLMYMTVTVFSCVFVVYCPGTWTMACCLMFLLLRLF